MRAKIAVPTCFSVVEKDEGTLTLVMIPQTRTTLELPRETFNALVKIRAVERYTGNEDTRKDEVWIRWLAPIEIADQLLKMGVDLP